MKNCPKCGAPCVEEAKYCSTCGSPLVATWDTYEEPDAEAHAQPDPVEEETAQNTYEWQSYQQNAYQQNADQQGVYQQNAYQQGGYQQGAYQQNTYQQTGYQYESYQPQPPYAYRQPPQVNVTGIRPRSIALAIVLTIVTFGIYGIYWMIKLNDEVNQMANEPNAMSGGLVFLLSLVTLGIFGLYWQYKMGERCDRIKGDPSGYSPILYLVFGILGLSIVSYALMQETINKCFPYSA